MGVEADHRSSAPSTGRRCSKFRQCCACRTAHGRARCEQTPAVLSITVRRMERQVGGSGGDCTPHLVRLVSAVRAVEGRQSNVSEDVRPPGRASDADALQLVLCAYLDRGTSSPLCSRQKTAGATCGVLTARTCESVTPLEIGNTSDPPETSQVFERMT